MKEKLLKASDYGDRENKAVLQDAYDIWYCIRNYEGGEEARKAYMNIADKFRDENDFGPETVRRFLDGSPDKCGDMTLDQIQTDAYLRVNKWCEILGLKK